MNWGRAKTILIILFLATDLFLLLVLMRTKTQEMQIPRETVENAVTIMASGGIYMDAESIPKRRIENRSMIMRNLFHEPEQAAKQFLGETVTTVIADTEQYVYKYESPLGRLFVEKDKFLYQRAEEKLPYRMHPLPEKEAVIAVTASALQTMGFPKNSFKIVTLHQEEGIYTMEAVPVVDGVQVYGIRMHIQTDSRGILSISGHWFEAVGAENNEPDMLLDITTVLVEATLKRQMPQMEIASVSHAYYASDDFLNSRELAAVPVYVICDTLGNKYMFDARVGSKVE